METSKLIISHRGNLKGAHTAIQGENHPNSIKNVLEKGFACEVDIRWIENEGYFLGHDKPEYNVEYEFLCNNKLYLHCKDILTLHNLKLEEAAQTFFHQQDDVVQINNSNYLWSYPRSSVLLTDLSIAVLPEYVPNWENLDKCVGFCTDYPEELEKNILFKIR